MRKIILNNQELSNLKEIKYTDKGIQNANLNILNYQYTVGDEVIEETIWRKPFTLSYSYDINSISSVTVKRGSDVSGTDAISNEIINPGATVYYGDELFISVTPKSGYTVNTYDSYVFVDTADAAALNKGSPYTGYRSSIYAPRATSVVPHYTYSSTQFNQIKVTMYNPNDVPVTPKIKSATASVKYNVLTINTTQNYNLLNVVFSYNNKVLNCGSMLSQPSQIPPRSYGEIYFKTSNLNSDYADFISLGNLISGEIQFYFETVVDGKTITSKPIVANIIRY